MMFISKAGAGLHRIVRRRTNNSKNLPTELSPSVSFNCGLFAAPEHSKRCGLYLWRLVGQWLMKRRIYFPKESVSDGKRQS